MYIITTELGMQGGLKNRLEKKEQQIADAMNVTLAETNHLLADRKK